MLAAQWHGRFPMYYVPPKGGGTEKDMTNETAKALAPRVVAKLLEKGKTLASAESCTGGLVAARVTDVAGCSAVFYGGCVTYTNEVKQKLVGVRTETLAAYTEVSAQTACEMARGTRERLGTDIGVSTTGFAGPGGGTEENPAGTVYIALSTAAGERAWRLSFGDIGRDAVREGTVAEVFQKILEELD